jgi:tetratricopeptide (TPR) repeat protein
VLMAIIICLAFDRAAYCIDDSLEVSQRTNQAALLNNQGLQLKQDGKLQESRMVLEQACLLDPNMNSFAVHENLGVTLQNLGELNLACAEFSKAIQFNPENPNALYNLAGCYSQMGEINQAILTLQNFLTKYPNNEKADTAKRMLLSLQRTPTLRDDPNASDYLAGAMTNNNKITRWPFDKQPIKVYIESGKKVEGYQPEFEEILGSAFDQWVNVVSPRLSWKLISKKRKADIICKWSSNRKNFQQSNGAELGETRLKYLLNPRSNDCEITGANITLCTMNLEGTKVISEEQMKNLCLHEVGHALGINGHSSNSNDVMFLMTKECAATQLTQRDKTTLAHLYSSFSSTYPQSAQNSYTGTNQPAYPNQNSYPSNYNNTYSSNPTDGNRINDKSMPF